jgi:hypothetical protein
MARIENIPDWEESRAEVLKLDAPGLVAQHLIQRGAVHALQTVLLLGATPTIVQSMLDDVKTMQDFVAATAAMRGVRLVSEE